MDKRTTERLDRIIGNLSDIRSGKMTLIEGGDRHAIERCIQLLSLSAAKRKKLVLKQRQKPVAKWKFHGAQYGWITTSLYLASSFKKKE